MPRTTKRCSPDELLDLAIARLELLTRLTWGLYGDSDERLEHDEMLTLLNMLDDIIGDLKAGHRHVTDQLNAAYYREHPEVVAAMVKAGAR